jgi:signal recognition particle receptor subunit beta
MVVVSYSGREINAKIVYYGPGLSGKTTNLEKIYDSVPETNRGRMVSMKTQTDRTLFFDLLPLDLGELQGMKTRFLLYTVPGQVYYNATRKLVLKGVDAVVFVADSAPDKVAENRESLSNLEQNLKAYGLELQTIPWVIQYNKRDLPGAVSVQQMNQELNRYNVPTFEAQAANGVGVFETLRGVSKLLLAKISKDVIDRDRGSLNAPPRVVAEVQKQPAAVEEAPTPSSEPREGRGKLLQFLKKGGKTGAETPAPAAHPVASTSNPPLEPPGPFSQSTAPEAPFTPPSSMQPDETVLTSDDLIPLGGKQRKSDPDPGFSADELEREADFGAAPATSKVPSVVGGDARTVTVPIDLGSLPSGRVRLVFEVRIEVDAETSGGRKKSSRSGPMMRDLETIPD